MAFTTRLRKQLLQSMNRPQPTPYRPTDRQLNGPVRVRAPDLFQLIGNRLRQIDVRWYGVRHHTRDSLG